MSVNYTLNFDGQTIEIVFNSVSLCDAVGKIEFCSRLLYKLSPDSRGIWTIASTPRIDAHIVGFPKTIEWTRPTEKTLLGKSSIPITDQLKTDIQTALQGIVGTKLSRFSQKSHRFSIFLNDTHEQFDYSFSSRSRPVIAFCVLWDQRKHPRDHLEVRSDSSIVNLDKFGDLRQAGEIVKLYGDPSKTIDELRNQGFPRATDMSPRGTYIEITRDHLYNTIQEHYHLVNRRQSLDDQVGRSQIPSSIEARLYAHSSNRCNNCGQQFPDEYLAPDHRVPSIVRADNLSTTNFLTVLQTLCVRCNQVKREACKKCPYEHQCDKCAWAYPEKHHLSHSSVNLIRERAESYGVDIDQFINEVLK